MTTCYIPVISDTVALFSPTKRRHSLAESPASCFRSGVYYLRQSPLQRGGPLVAAVIFGQGEEL